MVLNHRQKLPAFIILFVAAIALPRAVAQTQYSIGNPTPEQQYMLELINRARANGGAEAARLGLAGGLQEGPPMVGGQVWTIENSVQPLSWNPLLNNCAQSRAKFLNDNDQIFSGQDPHTFGQTDPETRIAAAGYSMAPYTGPTNNGFSPGPENVSEALSFGSGPYTGARLVAEVLNDHNSLFVDNGMFGGNATPGRGHRNT